MRRYLAAMGAIGVLLATPTAYADPQGTAGVTLGLAGSGFDREVWDQTVFHLGARGDILFLRDEPSDIGFGPYAEVFTHAFDELQFGGGASLLLPAWETFPFVLSGGGYGRYGDDPYGLEPGVTGQLFWGSRSFNYHSAYGLALGLLAQARVGLGDSEETSIVIGAQLDVVALSLPFLFLVNAARGPSEEAAPIE